MQILHSVLAKKSSLLVGTNFFGTQGVSLKSMAEALPYHEH